MVAVETTNKRSFKGVDLPIDIVTVYRTSGAQVVRKLDLDLKAGKKVIEVTGLSSVINTESLRVSGLGNARLLVANCIHEQFIEVPDLDQIRALKSQKRELEVEMEAIIAEIEILDEFGEEMGGMPDLTPDQANTFTDTFIEKTLACVKTVGELEDKIGGVNRRIDKAKSEKTGSAFVKAVITIAANDTGPGPVQLKLTYRVSDAFWSPLYDMYATSEDRKPSKSVSLHYRVNLQQSTGENWNDTKLILSTSATDMLDAGAPGSNTLIIQPKAQAVRKSTGDRGHNIVQSFSVSASTYVQAPPPVQPPPVPLPTLVRTTAIVSKSPMAVNYTVDEYTTIHSNHLEHKVLMAIIPFEATTSHITSPRKSPIVYLQCAVKNTSDYYLLPGTVSVLLDDSYVSKTDISEIATGDTFNCTLGMDTSIRISHELTQSSMTSPPSSFVEQYKTTTYVSTTKLHNRHTGDYPITIFERSSIPVASESDPRIKVFLKGLTGLGEGEEGKEVDLGRKDGFKVKWGRDVGDTKNGWKEGKFIWYGTIPPGEEVILVSEWDVRAPFDVEWRVKSE